MTKLFALLMTISAAFGQTATTPKAPADYGKDVTLQMLPASQDSGAALKAKCERLTTLLVDSQHANEDLSGVSEEVLLNLRANVRCAGSALADRDINALVSATSVQFDATNELLDRLAKYAKDKERQYDELLLKYRVLSAERAQRTASQCAPAITSQITGDYNGWNDSVIYEMTNGQIWKQQNYHYHYHYAYRPEVTIYEGDSGCHIKVEGDDDEGVDVVRMK